MQLLSLIRDNLPHLRFKTCTDDEPESIRSLNKCLNIFLLWNAFLKTILKTDSFPIRCTFIHEYNYIPVITSCMSVTITIHFILLVSVHVTITNTRMVYVHIIIQKENKTKHLLIYTNV